MKAKVTSRGQVSIPSEIRKKFNIDPESSGTAGLACLNEDET